MCGSGVTGFVAFGATELDRCLIKVAKTIHIFTIPFDASISPQSCFFSFYSSLSLEGLGWEHNPTHSTQAIVSDLGKARSSTPTL
jgi:hypothetical protein